MPRRAGACRSCQTLKSVGGMAVLSVDLAYKSYTDIGAVILCQHRGEVCAELLALPLRGRPQPEELATFLNQYCADRGIRVLLLDGPQAWKSSRSALVHSRQCERELNTPAKTGLPGNVKPRNYLPFVTFSIQVFDALCSAGWERLEAAPTVLGPTRRIVVESFPLSAWRALELPALPAKSKTKAADLKSRLDSLRSIAPLHLSGAPTHDELQAVVSGLAGIALESDYWGACVASGVAPFFSDGAWREGFIVNPTGRIREALSNKLLQPTSGVGASNSYESLMCAAHG